MCAFRPGDRRRAGADDADIQAVLGLYFAGDMRELDIAFNERLRDVAFFRRRIGARQPAEAGNDEGAGERARGEYGTDKSHAPPPARSASGVLTRDVGVRPSIYLYHDIRLAVATMIRMPAKLMSACTTGPPDHSLIMNCPAKAKNTPRQKISNECWPHTIAGCRNGDFSAGQSRGTKRTVTAASARKCAKRSTSRFVLSIGYIQSLNHCGTKRCSCSIYQVMVMAKAKAR